MERGRSSRDHGRGRIESTGEPQRGQLRDAGEPVIALGGQNDVDALPCAL